jgi:cation transport ATPase
MADYDPQSEARTQIAETEKAEAEKAQTEERAARAAGLFDLRIIIGGLLGLYGVVLFLMGLFASSATKSKAVGININLWAGLALLLVSAFFITWTLLRPLRADDLQDQDADPDRPNVE